MLAKFKKRLDKNILFNLQNKIQFDDLEILGSLFCINTQNLLIDGISALEFLESAIKINKKGLKEVFSNLFNKKIVNSIISNELNLNNLSGGEFQRLLNSSGSIISNAKFVFLDETTSGLDDANELKCINLFAESKSEY